MRGTKEIQTDHRSTDGDLIYAASIPLALLYPSRSFFFFYDWKPNTFLLAYIYIFLYFRGFSSFPISIREYIEVLVLIF